MVFFTKFCFKCRNGIVSRLIVGKAQQPRCKNFSQKRLKIPNTLYSNYPIITLDLFLTFSQDKMSGFSLGTLCANRPSSIGMAYTFRNAVTVTGCIPQKPVCNLSTKLRYLIAPVPVFITHIRIIDSGTGLLWLS
jgi:hypothetical protein